MGYTKSALSGFSWQTVLSIATAAITIGKLMILARLLGQTDFGLFAYVIIALGLTESLTQTGVNVTLIQSKRPLREYIDTAWIIAIARGGIIALIMVVLGWLMSDFFQEPSLQALVLLAALIPLIKGFINPYLVSFQKDLHFFKESVFRFSLVCIEAIAAVSLVLIWPSVVGLIFALIVSAIAEVLITFVVLKIKPAVRYSREKAREILANARGLGLGALLNYVTTNIDDLIIGRVLGTQVLGVYHNAYGLAHRPTFGFAQSLGHSTLPVFSLIQDDRERLRRAYLKSLAGIIALSLVGMSVAVFFPEIVVKIILGNDWLDVIPVLPWLAVAGFIEGVVAISYTMLLAKKQFMQINIHRGANLILLIPALFAGISWLGLVGAGIAWAVVRLVALPLLGWFVYKAVR